jgi:nicotinamidase-related amidase
MPRLLELEDHSDVLRRQNELLEIDPTRTAVVTVDLHRGHLDPIEATVPIGPELSERVIRGAHEVLVFARANGIAVVHVTVTLREIEAETFYQHPKFSKAALIYSRENPSSDAQRRGVLHNVEGSVQCELPPEIGPEPGDHWITTKKTYSSFIGTDLDNLLRRILGIDTVLIMGVNTNTCVLNAAFDACNHGYRAIVIEEGVASCYGEDLHAFALNAIARTCGWVLTTDELKAKVLTAVGAEA